MNLVASNLRALTSCIIFLFCFGVECTWQETPSFWIHPCHLYQTLGGRARSEDSSPPLFAKWSQSSGGFFVVFLCVCSYELLGWINWWFSNDGVPRSVSSSLLLVVVSLPWIGRMDGFGSQAEGEHSGKARQSKPTVGGVTSPRPCSGHPWSKCLLNNRTLWLGGGGGGGGCGGVTPS